MALILREKHVRSVLSMRDTIMVVEEAFGVLAQGLLVNQPRNRLIFPNGVLNILAAAAPTFGVVGLKTYTAFREGVRFIIMLYSSQDGQLLALIEADWLGAMRTGATSAIATKYLARHDASVVGLIGAGNQAVTQLMGICSICNIQQVLVYSRRSSECEIFCQEMTRLLGIEVRPVSHPRQAVEVADIVITATTASAPIFAGDWLTPGCHINAIGSNWAHRRELDVATLQRCDVIVTDSVEQAHNEAGDFLIPASDGLFDWGRVLELSDVVGSGGPVRELPEEITLYKGLGTALEDIVTAAHVYHLAQQEGLGEEIHLAL